MAERNPFEQKPAAPVSGRELRCEEWEALLADALDGVLAAADSVAFEVHSNSCATCSKLLAQARQGQEWMQFLHSEPELPGDLFERILGRTSGTAANGPLSLPGATPLPANSNVLGMPVRRMVWDTRLMMTAAMAFFSIALTLSLAGVRLTSLRLADLTPASMENNLTRQFYGAKIQVVRYYDNLRFVYEVESKMRELRRDEETQRPAEQQKQVAPPSNPQGNGHKNGGKLEPVPAMPKQDVIWGHSQLAGYRLPKASGGIARHGALQGAKKEEVHTLVVCRLDQAERGLA